MYMFTGLFIELSLWPNRMQLDGLSLSVEAAFSIIVIINVVCFRYS